MIKRIQDLYYGELEHEHRFMLSVICAELILLLILKLWPAQIETSTSYEDPFTDEVIYVERAIVTRQTNAPAAPPKPEIPVPVPNDEVIEEEIDFPEFDEVFTNFDAMGEEGASETGGEGKLVGSPEQTPRIVRIVEPTISDVAKRQNIKAEIIVTFLVGIDGQIEEAVVSEIRLYDGNSYEVVEQIGYGILEATLEAALKWRFIPARDDGERVKTYVQNSFNIGF